MSGFQWTDVYPGRRAVTLLLDANEAEELLDQAREEGRAIAPGTILGMPAIALDFERGDKEGSACKEQPEPDPKVVILPVVRRERPPDPERETTADDAPSGPRFDGRSPLAEKPPRKPPETKPPSRRYNPHRRCWERPGEISPADMEMVRQAVAEGRVTKCPPATFALDANDPGNFDWKRSGKPTDKATRR